LDFVCFSRIFTFYFYWFDGFMILKKEEMLHNSSGNMSSLGSSGAFASLGILLNGLCGSWCLERLFPFLEFFLSYLMVS
jgi:hypothetical protein